MQKEYSTDINENLKQRTRLLMKAEKWENKDEIRKIIIRKCKEDPLFFFNMLLWTYKPKAVWDEWEPINPNIPFITWDFQDEYILKIIHCIENQEDNITEKSREMWFSWQILWIWLWWFLFRGWSWLIWSYKEDYVDTQGNMDSAFERLRYMMSRLPKWIKPKDIISKYMSISSKTIWAEIAWDSWANFGTWWRRKWLFMDEFALWSTDLTAFRKTKDVTNCRIIGWTPEGKGNVYGKIMTNHPDYSHIKIKKFRLHWSQHPLKTQEWYERQKSQRTALDMAQEIDISYDNSITWAVYSTFEQMVRFEDIKYNKSMKLYTSWDFGLDSNALIFWQKDFLTDKLYIIKSIRRVWREIEQMLAFVLWEFQQGFVYTKEDEEDLEYCKNLRWLFSWHIWDPYNWNSKTTNAKQSISDIFQTKWIHLTLKRWSTVQIRIRATTLALKRITINPLTCIDLIESMRQSKYPKTAENSQSTQEKWIPIHDDNSHYRTAFEYFIDNEPTSLPSTIIKRKKQRWDPIKMKYVDM